MSARASRTVPVPRRHGPAERLGGERRAGPAQGGARPAAGRSPSRRRRLRPAPAGPAATGPCAASRASSASAPARLVTTTHSNAPAAARSRAASIALAGAGTKRMAGATITRAPRARRRSASGAGLRARPRHQDRPALERPGHGGHAPRPSASRIAAGAAVEEVPRRGVRRGRGIGGLDAGLHRRFAPSGLATSARIRIAPPDTRGERADREARSRRRAGARARARPRTPRATAACSSGPSVDSVARVVGARLHRQRALPGRGNHRVGVQRARLGRATTSSRRESRRREHERVDARRPPACAKPRVDVSAKVAHGEARPPRQQLGPAAKARRAHDRAVPERAVARHQHVARDRRARGRPPRRRPAGSSAGRSLAECTARSISPSRSAADDLVDEEPLHAERRRVGRRAAVAGRRHGDQLGVHAVRARRRSATSRGLRQGERRAAGADAEHGRLSRRAGTRCRTARPGRGRRRRRGPGPDSSFTSDGGRVQQLGRDAAGERLDGLPLLGLQRREPRRGPAKLGRDRPVAGVAQRPDQRRQPGRRAGVPRTAPSPRRRSRGPGRGRRSERPPPGLEPVAQVVDVRDLDAGHARGPRGRRPGARPGRAGTAAARAARPRAAQPPAHHGHRRRRAQDGHADTAPGRRRGSSSPRTPPADARGQRRGARGRPVHDVDRAGAAGAQRLGRQDRHAAGADHGGRHARRAARPAGPRPRRGPRR